jgi:excisionase family DNA binding protein
MGGYDEIMGGRIASSERPSNGPFRVGQVAEMLGVHRNTVLLWIDSGALSAFRTEGGHFRIFASAIDAFIDRKVDTLRAA